MKVLVDAPRGILTLVAPGSDILARSVLKP
jgi:hypothetical protein